MFVKIASKIAVVTFSLALGSATPGCGVKKVGGRVVDEQCGRDLAEVLLGEACPAATPEDVVAQVSGVSGSASVCTKGVNNNVCEFSLVEDSFWASEERSYTAPTGAKISYNGYYKFNVADQTWEHYLFQKIPFLENPLYERRKGSVELHEGFGGEYLVMKVDESSCTGQESLFEIFDTPQRDIYVGRSGNVVALSMSAEVTSAAGIKIEEYLEHIFASMYSYIYDVVFGPFTPEFWQSVVTGSYSFTATTQADFEAAVAGGRQTCFSSEGYAALQDDMVNP